ncbi:MAG: T9SS type A sorting domain-containing protein [Bacteroidales bacterium]
MKRHLIIFLCLFLCSIARAQIRRDGIPQFLPETKSTQNTDIYRTDLLPKEFKNFRISEENLKRQKSLQFAYPFYSHLNTSNSGKWHKGYGGTEIWTLKIKSADAKSINLIVDSFYLPPSAKLYIWGNEENVSNGYIGAHNNNDSKTVAIFPTKGDIANIQLEVDSNEKAECSFTISQVSHDFYGVFGAMKLLSGVCEINSNCNTETQWKEPKKAVCHMIIGGISLCTGTLMNNTKKDFTPYVLSANHCYKENNLERKTLYVFMNETPNCLDLDVNKINSISGGIYKASSVNQDYYLTEINRELPIYFQAYYAGWSREPNITSKNACIHHPQGDKKKISISLQTPTIETYSDAKLTVDYAWEIKQWNSGTTEGGSSGAGLFDNQGYYRGSLIGGDATCSNPVFDFFSAFYVNWDFETDSSKQLQYWLDPLGTKPTKLDGQFYDDNTCKVETNSGAGDTICNSPLGISAHIAGTNNMGVTEIVEKFNIASQTPVYQILVGIKNASAVYNKNIILNIYDEKNGIPNRLIYTQVFSLANVKSNLWHNFKLSKEIEVSGTFFVGFRMEQLNVSGAELSFFTTSKQKSKNSTFYYKLSDTWSNYYATDGKARSLLIGINQCSYIIDNNDSTNTNNQSYLEIYPNPVSHTIYIKSDKQVKTIKIIDLAGRVIMQSDLVGYLSDDLFTFDISAIPNGFYIVMVSNEETKEYFKVIINR